MLSIPPNGGFLILVCGHGAMGSFLVHIPYLHSDPETENCNGLLSSSICRTILSSTRAGFPKAMPFIPNKHLICDKERFTIHSMNKGL